MAITGRPADSTEQRALGVSKVENNLVAEGVRLVKNLNDCRAKFQAIGQRERIAADDVDNLSRIDDSEERLLDISITRRRFITRRSYGKK